jgi:hypothetical protein
MPTRPLVGAGAVVVVLAALAAGCGGGSSSSNEKGRCQGRLLDQASATVVSSLFVQGKLGSKVLVERELGRSSSGVAVSEKTLHQLGSRFFDANGRLLPYTRLTTRQKSAFNDWMYRNDRVHGLSHEAQDQADDAARARFDQVCG